MALLLSSYSPDVYDGAIWQYKSICEWWNAENVGIVTAMNDEQKTDETRLKVLDIVKSL